MTFTSTYRPPVTGGQSLVVNVTDAAFGGIGQGDDRTAIMAAVEAAKASGRPLYFPDGVYEPSKYIDVAHARGLRIIMDAGAVIRWPSADTTIPLDAVATSPEMARACFLLRHCSDVSIHGGRYVGQDDPNLGNNQGSVAYATRCVGTFVGAGASATGGYSIFAQDNQPPTSGTGLSITVSGSTATIVATTSVFVPGHEGRFISLTNCADRRNDRVIQIASYVSGTTVTVTASDMISETSSFTFSVDDEDRNTIIDGFHSIGQRGFLRTASHSIITNGIIERPTHTLDTCGRLHRFSITGTTVTLTSPVRRFFSWHVGKLIVLAGSTSAGNDGYFRIRSVASDGKSLTYTNASGVTEIAPAAGTWWVANGEKVGLGNGTSALSKSGSTMTLTADENAFTSSDIGKVVRVARATTSGNNGAFVITGVPAANQITYTNASGASETFARVWSIDSYDTASSGTTTHGSTHMLYIYADRENIAISNLILRGCRKTGLKGSGTANPQRGISMTNIEFIECAEPILIGADDSQEHTGYTISDITMLDCAVNRVGAAEGHCLAFLGSRGLSVRGVRSHHTHNAIGTVDGRGTSGNNFLTANRYTAGITQPIEDLALYDIEATMDPQQCTDGGLFSIGMNIADVGQMSYYRSGGTLTKSGNVMTLSDASAKFPQTLVGQTIALFGCGNASNDVADSAAKTIESVATNGASLTFTNASGVTGDSVGTYRIFPHRGMKSNQCLISRVYLNSIAPIAYQFAGNVHPVLDNVRLANGTITFNGDRMPIIRSIVETVTNTQTARLRFASGTTFPTVMQGNMPAHELGISSPHGLSIGVSGTPIDYPLLGVSGRMLPTQAKSQIVVGYGSRHVDGDTIVVNSTTFTYKAVSPTGNQFNSLAGLIALIDAMSGIDCVEYGAHLSPAAACGHLLISSTTAGASDSVIVVTTSTLNPTALVTLRNGSGANTQSQSRGAGSAGPVADKAVIWSPVASFHDGPMIWAGNAAAMTLLQASGWRSVKNSDDAGACEVVQIGTSSGTEELRWKY